MNDSKREIESIIFSESANDPGSLWSKYALKNVRLAFFINTGFCAAIFTDNN